MSTENGLNHKNPSGNKADSKRLSGIPIIVYMSLLSISIILLSGTVYYFLTTVRTRTLYREETRSGIRILSSSASTRLASLVALNDYEDVNNVMVETFGFNEDVQDALIITKKDGKIYYDLSGNREGRMFRDSMKTKGLEYFSNIIAPPGGVGIAAPQSASVATLLIGHKLRDPVSGEHAKAIIDYMRTVQNEVNLLLDTNQIGQARVFLVELMLNNKEVSSIQLIDNAGVIFINFTQPKPTTLEQGPEEKKRIGERWRSLRKPP